MKKILFILSVAVLPMLFAACNTKAEQEAAQRKSDSLQQIIDSKDGEIDALFDMLNQIEDNLALISAKYSSVQNLKTRGAEGNVAVKGEISSQINNIEQMLADNKAKIASLNSKISSMGKENTQLQEFVTKLEQRITEQETQISDLMKELENSKVVIKGLNENVSQLTQSNKEKDDYIAHQTAEANKAYFIVGSFKELKDMGIVNKSGGFIGLGKKQNTSSDMSTEKFQCIDRTKVTTITIGKKKAMVVSKHPQNSYELVMDENDPSVVANLRILNPATFWTYTDYLVVSTK